MSTKKIYFDSDYCLVDGCRVVRGHKTEFALGEFATGQLEKIKILAMDIALSAEEADTLVDCIVDEHFSSGGDIKDFDVFVERIGCFLDYYLDRLPKSVPITDQEALSDMEKTFGALAETGNGESILEEWPF